MDYDLLYECLKLKLDAIFCEEKTIQNNANDLANHLRVCKCCSVSRWHTLIDKQIDCLDQQNKLISLAEHLLPTDYYYLLLQLGINHTETIINTQKKPFKE